MDLKLKNLDKAYDVKTFPAFPKAPIVEAVLDIQVEQVPEMDFEKIGRFYDYVKERYSIKELRQKGAAGIRVSPQGLNIGEQSVQPMGYLYRSPDGKSAVQARLDGYTFNKFNPYEDWTAFSTEARKLWGYYLETAKPNRLKRLALRYINRIEIPLPIRDFKDYLLTVPDIAPKLPQALAHFIMRLVVPNPEIEATAVINVVMDQPVEAQRLPIIFDVDVYKITNIESNNEDIWSDFDSLRIFKNEIFFNSITDKTKELFR